MGRFNESNSVPLEPFLEAFERSGLSPGELALRCGHRKGQNRAWGDDSWARRVLGLKLESPTSPPRTRVSLEIAVRIARALDLDPVDCGL